MQILALNSSYIVFVVVVFCSAVFKKWGGVEMQILALNSFHVIVVVVVVFCCFVFKKSLLNTAHSTKTFCGSPWPINKFKTP